MSIVDEVRRNFEGFGPPCTPEEIARAEQLIGHSLPAVLRELYLSFDGLGVTGFSGEDGRSWGGRGRTRPRFVAVGLGDAPGSSTSPATPETSGIGMNPKNPQVHPL
jgi:hypothetical protein